MLGSRGLSGGGASSCHSCCRLSACLSGTQELLSETQTSHSEQGSERLILHSSFWFLFNFIENLLFIDTFFKKTAQDTIPPFLTSLSSSLFTYLLSPSFLPFSLLPSLFFLSFLPSFSPSSFTPSISLLPLFSFLFSYHSIFASFSFSFPHIFFSFLHSPIFLSSSFPLSFLPSHPLSLSTLTLPPFPPHPSFLLWRRKSYSWCFGWSNKLLPRKSSCNQLRPLAPPLIMWSHVIGQRLTLAAQFTSQVGIIPPGLSK